MDQHAADDTPKWCIPAVILAALVGLGLIADTARTISATYDEVAYLRIAAHWWRTGEQAEITRMGSPLTFWKLQQAPVFWALDRTGRGDLIDDPIRRQAELLPIVRVGASWVWLAAFGLTAWWARRTAGPRAMAFAAWLFTLSPNVLAHGPLITMEMPVVMAWTATFSLFWEFLRSGRRWYFMASAAFAGLAFSCKFTAVLVPPLLGLAWWADDPQWRINRFLRIALGVAGFTALMMAADALITGFARLPIAHEVGTPHPSLEGRFGPSASRLLTRFVETPIPQDWVGFITQMTHQRSGGSSYLLGERRGHGWWYYYPVALAVKMPLACGLLIALRAFAGGTWSSRANRILPTTVLAFLLLTMLGSSRNYGVRYLLPVAPLAVVWISGLPERPGRLRWVAWGALLVQAASVASVHPNELKYFNGPAGGALGGRRVLADSNLDWGQGLNGLRRLQQARPEFRDLTLYYFGDTEPRFYGVVGTAHVIDAGTRHPGLPARLEALTPFLGVSASLQWGPWGPAHYFDRLKGVEPVAFTDDTTIAIYRTSDLR